MDFYAEGNYKNTIRARLKELQSERPGLTLKKLAAQIPVQYTYLSKALNDERTHLSEDHLYSICQSLEFLPEETEFIFLQRSLDVTQDASRKNDLFSKIERLRKARNLNVDIKNFNTSRLMEEMTYLFDPLCVIVHMALDIEKMRKDPRQLCAKLGISADRLKAVIQILARNDFIEIGNDPWDVRKTKEIRPHFGRDHKLTRVHQTLLKTTIQSRLNTTSEEEKHSFLATFTLDHHGYEKIKEEFQVFLKKVEQIAMKSRTENVFQMNFDIFKWL